MAEPHELEERAAQAIYGAGPFDRPWAISNYKDRYRDMARAVLALVKAEQESSGNGTHQAIEWRASIRAWWLSHTAPQEK